MSITVLFDIFIKLIEFYRFHRYILKCHPDGYLKVSPVKVHVCLAVKYWTFCCI